MSAPDYDLAAFLEAVYGPAFWSDPHHASIRSLLDSPLNPRAAPARLHTETVYFGGDHGKPSGDRTAYVSCRHDGYRIIIDDIHTEDMDATETEDTRDTLRMWAGRRPSIADLVARIGTKRCNCNAGYLIREDTRQLVVCTRCDGFSTQRGRRFRTRR